jgi:DNA-binding MarR family transcriptional regulator
MTTTTETTTAAPPAEWLEDIAAVLTATDRLTPTEVAGGLAALGIPVLPTIPGGKDPLLSARHIDGVNPSTGEKVGTPCPRCHEWHLRPTRDHGATTDPETIGRYWGAHPEAGVGMKNHPRLIRGDGDHETREELKHSREAIGYGQPFGVPAPFEANTPGGTYRRRYLHYVPEGLPSAGGGTRVHGVSWYGNSGYVVVKGQHPNGHEYPRFYGTITELPETVALALARRVTTEGGQGGAPAASSASVRQFLETYTGTNDPRRLEYRQRAINSAAVGSRHLTAAGQLVVGFREALAGYYPARVLVEIIAHGLRATGWDDARFEAEWDDLQGWALGQIAHLTPETARADIGRRMAELSANALLARADEYPPELTGEEYEPPTDEAIARALAEYDQWEERSRSSSSAGTDDGHDGDRPPMVDRLLTLRQLADLPPPKPLIEGVLDLDNVGLLYGRRGSYKSFMALDMGLSVAAGIPWHGRDTTPGVVVYVAAEGVSGVYQRVEAWKATYPSADPGDRFLILPEVVNLLSPSAAGEFAELCKQVGASFVILDTLARCLVGGDENSSRDMGIAVETLDTVRRRTGAHVMPVHHSGKDRTQGARGSSALEAAADTVLELLTKDGTVTLNTTKQKNRPEGDPLKFVPQSALSSVVLRLGTGRSTGSGLKFSPAEVEALAALDEAAGDQGLTMTAWQTVARDSGVSDSTVIRARKRAEEAGYIRATEHGTERSPRWALTPLGLRIVRGTDAEELEDDGPGDDLEDDGLPF